MRPSSLGPVKRKCDMDDYEPIPKKWGLLITNNRFVMSFLFFLFTNKTILHQNIKYILIKSDSDLYDKTINFQIMSFD